MNITFCAHSRQHGQALSEGLMVLAVLLSLWAAVSWLGRVQDMALQAAHGSRYAAFAATRSHDEQALNQLTKAYFSGQGHQWALRSGQQILTSERSEITLRYRRLPALTPQAQAGGDGHYASVLREELATADSGILNATVSIDLSRQRTAALHSAKPLDLKASDTWWPAMYRYTAILTGAGHASDDVHAQQRLAASDTAWASSTNVSYSLAKKVDAAMAAVDAAWGRSRPVFDWLQPWAGSVPDVHLYP